MILIWRQGQAVQLFFATLPRLGVLTCVAERRRHVKQTCSIQCTWSKKYTLSSWLEAALMALMRPAESCVILKSIIQASIRESPACPLYRQQRFLTLALLLPVFARMPQRATVPVNRPQLNQPPSVMEEHAPRQL